MTNSLFLTSIFFYLCSACGSISFVWEKEWEESEHTDQPFVKKVESNVQHLLVSSFTVLLQMSISDYARNEGY